jgi:hypothetical protein
LILLTSVCCAALPQAAIYQFVGGELPPGGKAVDGLKQWQRTTLQQLGLLPAASDTLSASSSSSSRQEADGPQQPAAPAAAAASSLLVRIGGDPPVSPELLAAVRVVLATVSDQGGAVFLTYLQLAILICQQVPGA